MAALNRAPDDQKALVAHFDAFKFPTSEIVQFRALVTPCLPSCQPVICPVQDGNGLLQEIPSMGRRKRRMLNSTYEEPISNELSDEFHSPYLTQRFRRDISLEKNEILPQEEMLLVRSIHISDRFSGDKNKRDRKLTTERNSYHENDLSHDELREAMNHIRESAAGERINMVEKTSSGSCINLSTVVGAGAIVVGVQIAMLIIGAMLFLRRRESSKKLLPQQQAHRATPQTIFVKRY